ncbi:MAG TPA: uL15 family ribosomal protein [Candidatus Paceibacterota bacterium]
MQLHTVTKTHPRKTKKRIGRGGKRGTYSGSGVKGQKSRAGRRMRPEIRDIIKKLPKRRGYRAPQLGKKPIAVNIGVLDLAFNAGDTISPQTLAKAGLLHMRESRRGGVKILGTGTLSKKLIVVDCMVSKSAKEAIEKQGGSIKTKADKIIKAGKSKAGKATKANKAK